MTPAARRQPYWANYVWFRPPPNVAARPLGLGFNRCPGRATPQRLPDGTGPDASTAGRSYGTAWARWLTAGAGPSGGAHGPSAATAAQAARAATLSHQEDLVTDRPSTELQRPGPRRRGPAADSCWAPQHLGARLGGGADARLRRNGPELDALVLSFARPFVGSRCPQWVPRRVYG